MKDCDYVEALARGNGSLKYYRYWCGGIGINTKEGVREAIKLRLRVLRRDKITKKVEIYNYKTKDFEVVR